MKKSNSLMLSYMIFLVIALLSKILLGWEGLDQIAMGATVAGCFFAFADLASWYVSNSTLIHEAMEKDIISFKAYCDIRLQEFRTYNKEAKDTQKMVAPYIGQHENFERLYNLCSTRIEKAEQALKELEQTVDNGINDMQAILKKDSLEISVFRVVDMVLITLGFVVFFSLITFDSIVSWLENYQSHATLIAFTVIMLNYFLRDIIDEKTKNKVDEILATVEDQKNKTKDLEEKLDKTPLLDKAKAMITQNEDLDRSKEENSNEETENALDE